MIIFACVTPSKYFVLREPPRGSRLDRLGRSLKGPREPRHPKENQTPQQFGLKVFLFCCWTTVSRLRAMSLHLYFSKRKPCMGQPLVSSLKEAPAASITLKKPKKSAGTKKATKKARVSFKSREIDLVGSVHESDESHWRRHSGDPSSSTCGRCTYIRHKKELQDKYPWIRPRPAHMGGHWRLGCEVCHCVRNFSKGEKRGKGFPWGINKYPNVWADYNFSNNGTGGLARIKNRIQVHRRHPGHTIASTSFRSVYGRGDDNDAPAICGPCAPAIGGQCAPALGGQVAPALGGQCTPALGGQVAPTLGGPFVLVPLADFAAGADQCIATGRAPQSWAEQVAAIPMTKLSRWRACPT